MLAPRTAPHFDGCSAHNRRHRSPTPPAPARPRSRSPAHKRRLSQRFLMFVPSLSWHKDPFLHKTGSKKGVRFPHRLANLDALLERRRSCSQTLARAPRQREVHPRRRRQLQRQRHIRFKSVHLPRAGHPTARNMQVLARRDVPPRELHSTLRRREAELRCAHGLCRNERVSCFECFPYVCPEPVLVKWSF